MELLPPLTQPIYDQTDSLTPSSIHHYKSIVLTSKLISLLSHQVISTINLLIDSVYNILYCTTETLSQKPKPNQLSYKYKSLNLSIHSRVIRPFLVATRPSTTNSFSSTTIPASFKSPMTSPRADQAVDLI